MSTCEGAHQRKVTDMIEHIINGEKFILSSSQDGTIKVWKIEGVNLIFNKPMSDAFIGFYNTVGAKLEILFMNREDIGGSQVLIAGTNDNRLLFWVGAEMSYQQIVF